MRQFLLHRPKSLFHVLVLSNIQLQQLKPGGAKSGKVVSPGSLSPEAACKHSEAPLVQAACQLKAKAAVAPCYQYAMAMAILQGMLSTAPHCLDKKQQQHSDCEAAQSLAQQEGAAHGGGQKELRSLGMEIPISGSLQVWRTTRLPAGITPTIYKSLGGSTKGCCDIQLISWGSAHHVHVTHEKKMKKLPV